jgi:hypothetical protein
MSETAILNALLGHVATIDTGSPPLPIAWPNKNFEKPEATPDAQWLRATLLPAESTPISLPSDQVLGVLQIDVFNGLNGGEESATQIADLIIDHFYRGLHIAGAGGVIVRVLARPSRLPTQQARDDDPWIMLPIRIRYAAYVEQPPGVSPPPESPPPESPPPEEVLPAGGPVGWDGDPLLWDGDAVVWD